MIKLENLYEGVVEDVMDPLLMGRLRVRVFGVHTDNLAYVPTSSLPWATIIMPLPNAWISGKGLSPTGIVPGQQVVLIPRDPDFLQEWLVLGVVGGMQKANSQGKGFNDPSGLYPLSSTNHDTNVLARGKSGASVDILNESNTGTGTFPKGYGPIADKIANQTTDTVQTPVDQGTTPAPTPTNSDTPWMPTAQSQIGTNSVDNPDKIKQYYQFGGVSQNAGSVPWCACFVGWCLGQNNVQGTGKANARSYTSYGTDVMNGGNIPYGAIIVVTGNRGPSSGHVCFATGVSNGRVQVVGGNQGSHGMGNANNQNGGWVTQSSFPLSAVIAARFPPGYTPK